MLNEARKEAWLEGCEVGRRAALVEAGLSHREVAERCGCTERQVKRAVWKVHRERGEAVEAGTRGPGDAGLEQQAWRVFHGAGLRSRGEVEAHLRAVAAGERESRDVANLKRLAGLVGVDVAKVWGG